MRKWDLRVSNNSEQAEKLLEEGWEPFSSNVIIVGPPHKDPKSLNPNAIVIPTQTNIFFRRPAQSVLETSGIQN